jgi:hypothetical protein
LVLGPHDVDPALDEPSEVGEAVLGLTGSGNDVAKLLSRDGREVSGKIGLRHDLESVLLWHQWGA